MPIQAFSVRKEPKGHGAQKWVEGVDQAGTRVAIIEDVVTTGASTLRAIEGALNAGFRIQAVLALVDRQEGGREELQKKGYVLESIYTTEDLLRASPLTFLLSPLRGGEEKGEGARLSGSHCIAMQCWRPRLG
jgi:orotate phosphoribosyltransferase